MRARVLVAALLLVMGTGVAAAQERRVSSQRPLLTELLAPLDAGRLQAGAPVFLKVLSAWQAPGCSLGAGSTVSGRLTAVQKHEKQSPDSSLTVVLDTADCDGRLSSAFRLRVFAMVAGPAASVARRSMADRDGLFGSTSPRAVLGGPGGVGGASPPATPTPYDARNDMNGVAPAAEGFSGVISAGQTIGLGKLRLEEAEGGTASLISERGHNVRLERETRLVLMPLRTPDARAATKEAASADREPASAAWERTAAAGAAAAVSKVSAQKVEEVRSEPPDETEVCGRNCTEVWSRGGGEAGDGSQGSRFATLHLGYTLKEHGEFREFGHDSAVLYLGGNDLLFTFDAHGLRHRSGEQMHPQVSRPVRAVLLDPETRTVKRVLDWRVEGEGQYVWPAGPDRVLVHMRNELRVYGPGLERLHSATIADDLVWVTVSPSGEHIAVGTLRERHTPALHALLEQTAGVIPEEGVDVQVFDRDLRPVAQFVRTTSMPVPVLSDGGELLVSRGAGNRWGIVERSWEGREHAVATTVSTCEPEISAPVRNSMFVVGCSQGVTWYRMLRMNGQVMLKARGSSQEIEQAVSSAGQEAFAVRVVRLGRSTAAKNPFHKDDVREEEIDVYRSSNGSRMTGTIVRNVPLTKQSFALSPDGRQMAVLGTDDILFLPIGPAGRERSR